MKTLRQYHSANTKLKILHFVLAALVAGQLLLNSGCNSPSETAEGTTAADKGNAAQEAVSTTVATDASLDGLDEEDLEEEAEQEVQATASSSITVYHDPGKGRVHIDGCRRLPDDRSGYTVMTMAEAEAKGLPLCSRCPGSDTLGKGNSLEEPAKQKASDKDLPESWVNPAPEIIEKKPFKKSPYAPLVTVGADGRLRYNPYTDKGDRILDWSTCGYKRSEVPIPSIPAAIILEPLAGETEQVGNMAYEVGPSSQARIEEALYKVAAMEPKYNGYKGAVVLRKGKYYIDGSLVFPSGVVLRGEGDADDGTVLIATRPDDDTRAAVITIGAPDGKILSIGEAEAIRIAEAYVPSGTRTIKLEDASQFKVGDYVCVKKTVNDQWIEDLGMGQRLRHIRGGKEGAFKKPWRPEAYQFRHIRQIAAVKGDSITLDVMLPQSFEDKHGGGEVFKVSLDALDTLSGVESLAVVSNYDTTVKDESKSSDFLNFSTGVRYSGIINGWVRNVSFKHFKFAAVSAGGNAMYTTTMNCKYLEPVGPKRGGNRYSFAVGGGTGHLFYNCFSEDARHCFAGGSRNMGPYAFVNCTSVRGGQSEPHHRWGTGFLYDNVITKDGVLAAINRGDSGSGHGWSASNTLFWNCDAKNIVIFDPETTGENNFAIGYRGEILDDYGTGGLFYANSRAGYWGTPQEGAYYGFALMGNGHIESPQGPVKPDSLFIKQLEERIGKEQAAKVINSNVVFEDSMLGNWHEKWFLDGEKAVVEHRDEGLYFSGGTVTKAQDRQEYHAHHAVLWTHQEFEGDLRITYEMTRVDESDYGNTLLYIQAQGVGAPDYPEDITEWSNYRQIPAMDKYFENMDLISLSFRENIRCKRYPFKDANGEWYPERGFIHPIVEYEGIDAITPGQRYHVEVVKLQESIRLQLSDAETGDVYIDQTWDLNKVPETIEPKFVESGRIGLRHMSTKQFIYRDFRVEQL